MSEERQVIHLEVPGFAVAVERVVRPRLVGRPVVVAPPTHRAPVLAASPEARRAGIRVAMPAAAALRRCRDLEVIEPDPPLYARAAAAVREVVAAYSPLVEPVGLGRTFLDATGTGRLFGPAVDLAWRLRGEVLARLRLTPALGVAPNKLCSRVAADEAVVAEGLHQVNRGKEADFLAPLPVRRLPGIGDAIRAGLAELNVRRVRELAALSVEHLTLAFGPPGLVLHQRARGIDPTPVRPPAGESVVREDLLLDEDTNDRDVLWAALLGAVERAAARLRQRGVRAGRVDLSVRYADGRGTARSRPLRTAAALDAPLARTARALLLKAITRRTRVRSLTLRLAELTAAPRQLELFSDTSRRAVSQPALTAALDRLRRRHGAEVVQRGARLVAPR
jgi:DNA polymerase-4